LQATQGRLLTRGEGSDSQKELVGLSKEQIKEQKEIAAAIKEGTRLLLNTKGPTINFEAVA
jgi:hypothetical protein